MTSTTATDGPAITSPPEVTEEATPVPEYRIQLRLTRRSRGSWEWRIVDQADKVARAQDGLASYRNRSVALDAATVMLAELEGADLTAWHDADGGSVALDAARVMLAELEGADLTADGG